MVASMPTPRCRFAAVALGDFVSVFGGLDADDTALNTVARYDALGNVWKEVTAMPTARFCVGAAVCCA